MARAKKPIWDDDAPVAKFPRLEGDLDVDVAVVGGGITGVTAAYLLAKKNLRVVLIEKDAIGHGATGVTTAFLTQSLDTDPQDLEKMLGKKSAELAYQSHGEAIDTVEKIITKEGIDCEFMRCSNFFFASADDQSKEIDSLLAGATALGLPMKKATAALPFKHFGALDLSDQAKFHPLKYLYALAKKAEEYGAQIHEKTEAKSLSGEGPITIETARGTIHARYALLATYEPFTKPISLYFKKAFYTTYMLAGKVKKDFLPEATYEDLSNPYNYFRIDRGGKSDRIVFGGADHRSDVKVSPAKNFKAIEAFIDEHLSQAEPVFENQWTGQILEPIDGLAMIGQFGSRYLYVAMGFSGNGMTYGTIAAKMFTDHVMGDGSPYSTLYDPARIPDLKDLYIKGRDYVQEFFGGAVKNAVTYDDN